MKIAGFAFALVGWLAAGVGVAEDEPAPATRGSASAPVTAQVPAPVQAGATLEGMAQAGTARPAGTAIDAAASPAGRPRGVPPASQNAAPADAGNAPIAPAVFVAEEKWGLAGYNNNEPIYTILVTNHDARILRCTADLHGTYIENGRKLGISDRQSVTVFPNEQVQVGNWSGMDQASGATYSVKCRPV